ncbi:hypothetical protein AB0B30_32725 [Streptomyces narbonensis]|uniref:Uncharacterized protein n=1 Tax=Streptomyces narbonensis TaxID=67333 RepID=A0ABV3CKP3_9ACTN
MPGSSQVITANLGAKVAAFTCNINGRPVAVINTEAAHHPELRTQAAFALAGAGLDAGLILGALHGVRR